MSQTCSDPFLPEPAVIRRVERELPDTATYYLEFQDASRQGAFRFAPGQFNMLYVPGVGEVPISIASAPHEGPEIAHTIRFVGRVTHVIERLQPGGTIGLRGPYGAYWPLETARGSDVLLIAGGLGLAPLRPVIETLLAHRGDYGQVMLLYGARSPTDLLYTDQYAGWQQRGLQLLPTVDRADAAWSGHVGVVPVLLEHLSIDPQRTVLFTCGPEIMMRFTILEALSRQIPLESIYLSIELNMQCAVGLCGRCQLGPYFVCKDGPVFAYRQIERFLKLEHF